MADIYKYVYNPSCRLSHLSISINFFTFFLNIVGVEEIFRTRDSSKFILCRRALFGEWSNTWWAIYLKWTGELNMWPI